MLATYGQASEEFGLVFFGLGEEFLPLLIGKVFF